MAVIELSVAKQEVEDWLNKKKIFASTREAYADGIALIAEAISEGILELNDSGEFTHNLITPLDQGVKVLKYKSRLNQKMLIEPMKGIKASDSGDARLVAYCAALCNEGKGVIMNLDSLDYKIISTVVLFFI